MGFLSGAVAIFLRKGSRRHRVVGNVFVVSMLTLAATGVYMALVKWQPGNILGGTLTGYLVATGWLTARRTVDQTGLIDWGALAVTLAVAAATVTFAIQAAASPTGLKYEAPAGQWLFLGSIALLATVGDMRLIFHLRRSFSPRQRLGRHLWRMCVALFIASGSIFLARMHLFPEVLRKTGALFVLTFFPLVVMIAWLIRLRMAKAEKKKPASAQPDDAYALRVS